MRDALMAIALSSLSVFSILYSPDGVQDRLQFIFIKDASTMYGNSYHTVPGGCNNNVL